MKEIELTQGLKTLVDDEDYDWLTDGYVSWHIQRDKHTNYAYGSHGRKKRFKMHIEIIKRYYKEYNSNCQIDHKDHNGLNNQKYNLRICDKDQNRRNARPDYNGTSKFKGVSLGTNSSKWQCFIFINKKLINIGAFYNEIDAAIAYDIYAKKYFGEFAYLNFQDIGINEVQRVQKLIDNPKKWANTTSKYVGVFFNKNEKVFISYLNINKKRKLFGRFKNENDAAQIRNEYIINNNLNQKLYKLNILQ